ncbi:Hsp20/alpha crystallin family protein [Echinicola jeungdonensis]|uniref:Hsp20/alpha crystallin family protein n=1 Tax=Echinicola jeungdonensis TaxID=709343 RepID=A0ABV5J5Y9_9BACT|nr:Hsp20/alpha crystallin family protein [Echinicola jeungdonensis]MDN3668093.1 Hsp20/alpha crystallin family protein [Echinicola jeungdonensis]
MNLEPSKTKKSPSIWTNLVSPLQSLLGKDLFDSDIDLWPQKLGINVPTVNTIEKPKAYELEMAAPGLEKKDFKIQLDNQVLTISSEKSEEKEENEKGSSRKEFSFHSFCRSFSLPENVLEDKIEAKYENGILKIIIPKAKETSVQPTHQISID